MKNGLYILILLCGLTATIAAQERGSRAPGKGGFSLSNLTGADKTIPDSLLVADSAIIKGITGYHVTSLIGDPYVAPMDTNWLNIANSTLTEGKSLGVGYLANLGSAAQTRIFSERKEARDFMFVDAFDYWITTPENAYFYDTKIPYTSVTYNTDFASEKKTDQLKGVLTVNFGKRVNIGGEADYIYSRGFYRSNGNKLLSYRLFGNYLSDHYELRAYLSNYNFVYHENGGLTDDRFITDPNNPDFTAGKQQVDSRSYSVRYADYFNRVRGKNYFLTHRYNLGFHRTLEEEDEEGNPKSVFVPVSSIIHTLSYEDNRRHAYAIKQSTAAIDTCYPVRFRPDTITLDDRASYWKLSNTLALSLREGFQDWVKFGLTAFVNFEKRQFELPPSDYPMRPGNEVLPTPNPDSIMPPQPDYHAMQRYDEFSTYIGADIYKRLGSILTYNARGELAIAGDDLGEFRLSANLQSTFPLFKKEAFIKAEGYFNNVRPSFFMRHNSSRYYEWDLRLANERRMYAGGSVGLESTRTQLSVGVNNVENYVFFNRTGMPEQLNGNIQVITGRFKQDFRVRGFGWENEIAYQLSSNEDVLPLPEITAYSNMYIDFKLAKVLSIQVGADVHYHTAYYAPYYEPATLQFQLQDPAASVKVGNYPLINGYVNFHLKQARFFLTAYNLGSMFVSPNYFSLPHYPLDPMVIKAGVAVKFNN